MGGSLPSSFPSPAPKMRRSADSWQPEGASLESCCSASSAHGTARTKAQRLGLLACLAPQTSNVSYVVRAGHLRQPCSENANVCRLLAAQKGLAWKAVAQPPLPMALLAQRHRDWGCLLVLPPQISDVSYVVRSVCLR